MTDAVVKKIINADPYPGLRPFQANEAHLFFGRELQVEKLLEKIQDSHFVAVLGPSGCGKSSLVKAGLIPELKTGMMINQASKCRVVEMHPGDEPYKNLARALHQTICKSSDEACINAELKRSHKGLIEAFKYEINHEKEYVLLVVDQFEELFRYRQNNNIDEVMAFISLLIYAASQQEVNMHVVMTMRSDFLGECSLFPGLPELLNDNQFLTPRLTREQLKEAIEGPALVCDGKLDPLLVNTLLNDIGVDHDQLPLLQHVLKRMWSIKKETIGMNVSEIKGIKGEANIHKIFLKVDDYINIGRLNKALSDHANFLYDNKLNDQEKYICEVMFRRMSDRNLDQKDVRKPAQIREIANIARVSTKSVINTTDYFRDTEYNFISPSEDISLQEDSFIDISHESIIRQWDKMRIWIEKEYAASKRYVRLMADSYDYFNQQGELLTGNDVKSVLEWKNANRVNDSWAIRYGSGEDFTRVIEYIDLSVLQARKLRKRNKISKALRYGLVAGIVLVICGAGLYVNAYKQREKFKSLEATQKLKLENEFEKQKFEQEKAANDRENELKNDQILKINEKNDEISKRSNLLRIQNEELKRSSIIKEIQDLPVYQDLDELDRKMITKVLVPLYIRKDSNKIEMVIDQVDKAKLIEASVYKQDPNDNFRAAFKLWRESNSPLINSILLKAFNRNLYYKASISFSRNMNDFYSFVLSGDNRHFAVAKRDGLQFGSCNDDQLTIYNPFDKNVVIRNSLAAMAKSGNRILTSAYSDEKFLALWDQSGQLVEYANGQIRAIKTFGESIGALSTKISPLGQYLVKAPYEDTSDMYFSYDYISERNIEFYTLNNVSVENFKILDSSVFGIRTIKFSPDETHLLLIDNNDDMQVWQISPTIEKLGKAHGISAATFTKDGQYIIIASAQKLRKLDLKVTSTDFNDLTLPDDNYDFAISEISCNNAESGLLVKTNSRVYVLGRKDGKQLFVKDKKIDPLLSSKRFSSNEYFNDAGFIGENSVITIGNQGEVRLWKVYPDFKSPDEAFNSIVIEELSDEEKISFDSVELNNVLNSSSIDKLHDLATKMRKAMDLATEPERRIIFMEACSKIYQKLSDLSRGSEQSEYENQLLRYNDMLNILARSKLSLSDVEAVNKVVNRLSVNIAVREKLFKDKNDTVFADGLSRDYWNLSWYLLFVKNFNGAVNAAQRGLTIYPANDGMITNLALGYLLADRFDQADSLYTLYKGKRYKNQERYFTNSFLKDMDELEQVGIITPSNESIYQKVEAIRLKLK